MSQLDIVFLGDVIGRSGRKAVQRFLPDLKNKELPSVVIANVENAASGFGLTNRVYKELMKYGVDYFTGGNHIWDKEDVRLSPESFPFLATPANSEKTKDDNQVISFTLFDINFTIISLLGTVFMSPDINNPFLTFDDIYQKRNLSESFVIVDFHGEATSEKAAFGNYVSGRANTVFGTHTHVQTSDERMIGDDTFFITDVGMCGAYDSIIGMKKSAAIDRFLINPHAKLHVETSGRLMLNAVVLTVDINKKKIINYKRVVERDFNVDESK